MKNSNPFSWILICLMVPLLMACPEKTPEPKSKTELITKNWKVREVRVTNSGKTSVVYANPAGSTSNTQDFSAYRLNFKQGNTFARTEVGGTAITEGTWQFDNNDNPTKITFSTGNPAEVGVTVEENRLIVKYTITSNKNGNSDYVIELIPAE